jgi:uncharacterized protein (TIGR04222 family)
MSPEHTSLWDRILAFDIDGDSSPSFSFAARLARDNGWSAAFAERVVVEYKRFVFLAMTGGQPVTPSDQVDQAWHLHLTYTRSYWQRLCEEVLGRPLHHEPTKGGRKEAEKFKRQYNETLTRYREVFGVDPPSDIWPPAEVRFGADRHFVRVNTARRSEPWGARFQRDVNVLLLFVIAIAPIAVLGLTDGFGMHLRPTPVQWINAVVGSLIVVMVLLAAWLEVWLARRVRELYIQSAGPVEDVPPLDRYDVAYLLDGERRVVQTAITRLVATGVLTYDMTTNLLKRTGELADDFPEAERAVLDSVMPEHPKGTAVLVAAQRMALAVYGKFAHLERGLVPPQPERSNATSTPRFALFLFFSFGLILLMVGLGFLRQAVGPQTGWVFACLTLAWIAGGVVFVWRVGRKPVLTEAGEAAVREYEKRMGPASQDDPGLRVALSGPWGAKETPVAALVGVLALINAMLPPAETDAVGGAGSDDGDDGESGCSGCGGCGCGD